MLAVLPLAPLALYAPPSAPLAIALRKASALVVEPVPLPDVSLPDAEYKSALSALLSNAAKRPGVYVSLAGLISRETPPPHAPVIVDLLSGYLSNSNALDTVIPLKVLGRCGKAAHPAMARVMTLAGSPLSQVRLAVAEALGGMFYAPANVKPSCPASVTVLLTHLLQYDRDRGTKRAAAVALGRCRVANRAVVTALAAVVGSDDTPVALGAMAAVQALGTQARLALPAVRNRLMDKAFCANAVPALLAVASPQEAVDAVARTLREIPATAVFYSDAANRDHLQTLLYHAQTLPIAGTDTAGLTAAVAPRMRAIAVPVGFHPDAEAAKAAHDAHLLLRLSATKAFRYLSPDVATAATALCALAADATADTAVRRTAVTQIGKLGAAAIAAPAVLLALQTVLASPDAGLQGAAITVLNQAGGSAAQSIAPRLSALLLTAWKARQNARVYSLMNALYRMGVSAKTAATPVLKKILATEPPGSANAELAQTVLDKMSEPADVSAS